MHTTIRDILARETIRQAPATENSTANDPNADQEDQALMTPDDIGQQEQEQQMKEDQAQNEGEFPMHEVDSEPARYPVEQAKGLHSFLKNAAGGTGTFVTSTKESHEKAKQLAKSGHLQHHGSRLGGAGGGLRHVWSLTPKGMAAIGQQAQSTRRPGQGGAQRLGNSSAGQRPGGQRPQMSQRPGSGQFGSSYGR